MKYIFSIIILFYALFANAQTSQTVCEGSAWPSITVNCSGGTAPYTVSWISPSSDTTTGLTKTLDEAGIWQWLCEDENCEPTAGTHTITVEPDPTDDLEITAENKCINVGQTISASGVPGGYTYAWNFGSGATPTTSTMNAVNVSYSTSGTKTITLNITKSFAGNGPGCTESCSWSITKNITIGALVGAVTCN